jgi:hypothetical protein
LISNKSKAASTLADRFLAIPNPEQREGRTCQRQDGAKRVRPYGQYL